MYYNATKCGVDTLDQNCSYSNVTRKTRRWAAVVFAQLINIVMNNMFIVNTRHKKDRHHFNRDLALALARPFAEKKNAFFLIYYRIVIIYSNCINFIHEAF